MSELPRDIKNQLAAYLRLEFGEDDREGIQAADLKYVGARKDGRAQLHFWEYPSGSGKSWVTARVTESECALSTSLEGPNGETNDPLEALRTLIVEFGCRKPGQMKIKPLRLEVSDIEDSGIPVQFPTGETISFYAEVYPPDEDEGPDVSVQVLQDDDVILAVRCTSGVVISFQLAGYDCLMRLGTGPWEG